jgi:Common central domain of tyrosinase
MARTVRRRAFMQGVVVAAIAAFTGLLIGCGDDNGQGSGGSGGSAGSGGSGGSGGEPGAKVVRRSAKALTSAEIDRFTRAFEYAVAQGFFDVFNDEHFAHARNRHHGADLQATSPITVMIMSTTCGYRLLPWHRSFLIEAEQMLRAALRQRDSEEGKDPSEADLLFIPYWDAAHDQGLPQWVLDLKPKGGTAIVPEGLPQGHAGYGKPVGERYPISFGRWPGKNVVFDTLHTPDYVGRILAKSEFTEFYDALDVTPEIVAPNYPKAMAALEVLEMKLPGDASVQLLSDALSQPPGDSSGGGAETFNALFELGWRAAVEGAKAMPDVTLIGAVKDVYSLFNFMPHVRMHLWSGGLDPANVDVRGTVTYFNELTVDPVFWMLHGELDRTWYTWEEANKGKPPLSGDDALFNPLRESEGAFYGGGKTYTLDELTDHGSLPYSYDQLFKE